MITSSLQLECPHQHPLTRPLKQIVADDHDSGAEGTLGTECAKPLINHPQFRLLCVFRKCDEVIVIPI